MSPERRAELRYHGQLHVLETLEALEAAEREAESYRYNAAHAGKIEREELEAEKDALALVCAEQRAALEKLTTPLVAEMERHGSDWRTRMPLWLDTMTARDKLVLRLALIGEAALAQFPTAAEARVKAAVALAELFHEERIQFDAMQGDTTPEQDQEIEARLDVALQAYRAAKGEA